MPFYTPLRYPGGKRRLVPLVMRLLETNGMHDIQYVEPCAGGASIGLALLFEEYASTIHINDLSRAVYAFWHAALNDTEALCNRIEQTEVTLDEWHRQRAVYDARDDAGLAELGFATFFLNRTNRSGILRGGVIGGKQQTGQWKLSARFNKEVLMRRIRRIGRYRNRIRIYQQDALAFTDDVVAPLKGDVFAFYDPPYIENGEALYLNTYAIDDHRRLSESVSRLHHRWVVTYDYSGAIRHQLYADCRRLAFGLKYVSQARQVGREAMFFSPELNLPTDWCTGQEFLMARKGSPFPVYGTMEVMDDPSHQSDGNQAPKKRKQGRGNRISLFPLSFEEALKGLLGTPPPDKEDEESDTRNAKPEA
jgi:DNA adenine methylase